MDKIIRFIGIDFGTSTSVVSYLDYREENGKLTSMGNLQSIVYGTGTQSTLIPTIIKLADDKTPELFGNDVSDNWLTSFPNLVEQEFKMNLGSSVKPEERKKATELLNKFFEYLYKGYVEFERTQGNIITERRVYVSYPAKWEQQQKSLTINAAYEAFKKFPEVEKRGIYSMDEPTSALNYCIFSKDIDKKAKCELEIDKSSFVLLIDMGAGTTDLVLYKYIPNKSAEVLAKYPDAGKNSTTFGGREVDEAIKKHFMEKYNDVLKGKDNLIKSFFKECKGWKETLSKCLTDGITPPSLPATLNGVVLAITDQEPKAFSKDSICWLLRDYLPEFPKMVNTVIKLAMDKSQEFREHRGGPDFVILSGGHSQWFFIEEMLNGKWIPGLPGNESLGSGIELPRIQNQNWRIIKTKQPQHIISHGLCMSGMPIKVKQISNSDVWIELRLGNSIPKRELILKKGTVLPHLTKYSQKFTCRLDATDYHISTVITPFIGVKGDEYLDSIQIKVGTNMFKDVLNFFSDNEYRFEEIEVDLEFQFDENQLFSFSGTVQTPGFFGNTEKISMSAIELAQKICITN